MSDQPRLRVHPRGPLYVEGKVELTDLKGNPIPVEGRPRLLICRCASSRTQPFCDGSHHRAPWPCDQAARESAAAEAEVDAKLETEPEPKK